MPKHSIQMYTVRVAFTREVVQEHNRKVKETKKGDKIDYIRDLPRFDGQSHLARFLHRILKEKQGKNLRTDRGNEDHAHKHVQLLKLTKSPIKDASDKLLAAEIIGMIGLGESGLASRVILHNGGDDFKKGSRDIDEIPLLFYFLVPETGNCAFLLVQMCGTRGAKGILQHEVEQSFAKRFPDYRLRVRPAMPREYLQKLDMDDFKKITFVKQIKKLDRFDTALELSSGTTALREEVTYTTRGSQYLRVKQAIKDYVTGAGEGLSELIDGYDDVKIQVKVGDSLKMMRLKALKDVAWSVEIPDNVVNTESGHPRYKVLRSIMRDTVADMMIELGGFGTLSGHLKAIKDEPSKSDKDTK